MKKQYLNMSLGKEKAELVLKNCQLINVYSGEILKCDIAIANGYIIGIGNYEGIEEHDMQGYYVAPGLIDGHVHIESSMVTPKQFAKAIVPKGTTTIIADPHEIANVCGVSGIEFMLNDSKNIPLNVYMMIPSCVPATKDENSGAVISVEDIKKLKKYKNVIGLGEVMDYPSVLDGEADIHQKIKVMKHKIIDGHAPDVMGKPLNAYRLSGITTDHECTHVKSMQDHIQKGFYVHLRQGSQTRNTETLLKGINKYNIQRCLFCTDDKHLEDIFKEGHINYNVNLAISSGIEPIEAIRMATLNAANCYGLKEVGAIAPGLLADMIVFKYLNKVEPVLVYKQGVIVAKEGKALFNQVSEKDEKVMQTVTFDALKLDFKLKLNNANVSVIGLIKDNITTEHLTRKVILKNGVYQHNPKKDILKLAVIERHHQRKTMGLGLVEGFGLIQGAIASTIAHDSHNLVIIGSDDLSMQLAAQKILELQGGIVIVRNNQVVSELQLEIAGIMTYQMIETVSLKLSEMKKIVQDMGLNKDVSDPFIALAFLALPVIPKLKLTDRGLFDVDQFKIIPIEANIKESL